MLLFFVLELYRQCFCFLFWNCIDNAFVYCFGTVSTMLLFFVSIQFQNKKQKHCRYNIEF
jgi:hypothetical protein